MKNHADQLSFRGWLVKQLQIARWSAPAGLPLPAVAQKLGVTLDVLEEALAAREAALKASGRPLMHRGKRTRFRSDYAELKVTMPTVVYRAWQEILGTFKISSSALLRSLVHAFLLHPHRPERAQQAWHYQGQVYHLIGRSAITRRESACTRVTRGAQIALDHHADAWSIPASAIMRGLVVDVLEGRKKRLKIVGYPELWGDPDRYLHPEKFS